MPGLFDYPTLSWLPEAQARAAGGGLLGSAAPPQSGFSRFMGQAGDWIKQNPEALAQLQGIGATMLANSGGHWGRGGGFGQALGEGLLGGMRAGQQYKYGKYLDARTQSEQAQGEIEKQKLDLLKAGKAGPDETFSAPVTVTGPDGKPMLVQPGNRGTIRPVSGYGPTPDEAKVGKPMHLGGGILYDPATGKTFEAPGVFDRELALRAAGGTRVSTNVSPTAIYKDTTGAAANPFYKQTGEALVGSLSDATEQQKTLSTVQEINRTLEGIGTGPMTPTKTKVLKYAQQLGWKGNEKEIANVEAAGELSAGLVLGKMKQLGGNDTEEERNFITDSTATSIVTPEGRKTMEYIQQRRTARARKQAQFDGQLSKQLFEGNMDPAEVTAKSQEFRNKLIEEDSKTWKPPAAGAGPKPAPAAPSLGSVPGAGGPPKRIKLDANGNIVP